MAGRRYKKGMADASRAYQAFGQKQEDALRYILNEVQGGRKEISDALGELDTNFDNLYDRLDASEKEKLYSVSMPFDIKALDEYEKMFLIGALFALAEDCHPTENQKKYILTLKKYLEIPEPPKNPVDLMNIENLDSVEAQKAIYQVVLEYLSLQDDECFDVTDLQTDFLDSFNLSPKIRRSITARVNFLYDVTGTEGLVEKYGFVNQEEIHSKEAEELERIRKAELSEQVAMEVVNKVAYRIQGSTLTGAYEICAETDNYILLGRRNKVTNEDYITIDKRTADETFVGDLFNRVWPSSFVSGEDAVLICDESEHVHIVDLEKRIAKKTELTVKHSDELLAVGNGVIVAYKVGGLIIYNISNETVSKLDSDGGMQNRKVVITENGFFLSSHYSPLQYYNFGDKTFSIIYEPKGSSKIHHIQYNNGSIYVMTLTDVEYGCGEYEIFSVDCTAGAKEQRKISSGYIYSNGKGIIKNCENGWCFIEEASITDFKASPKFLFSYFDMETNEKRILTDNFGRYDWVKTGLVSKKDIYREVQSYNVIGSKILYYHRINVLTSEYRCLDIHKPSQVTAVGTK